LERSSSLDLAMAKEFVETCGPRKVRQEGSGFCCKKWCTPIASSRTFGFSSPPLALRRTEPVHGAIEMQSIRFSCRRLHRKIDCRSRQCPRFARFDCRLPSRPTRSLSPEDRLPLSGYVCAPTFVGLALAFRTGPTPNPGCRPTAHTIFPHGRQGRPRPSRVAPSTGHANLKTRRRRDRKPPDQGRDHAQPGRAEVDPKIQRKQIRRAPKKGGQARPEQVKVTVADRCAAGQLKTCERGEKRRREQSPCRRRRRFARSAGRKELTTMLPRR